MLRPVFSFFNGCEGLGAVWADACPAARPDPREVRDKRERHAKPLLQRRHARTQRVPQSGTSMRNPLQAVKRRSCGYMQPHAHCSAKRDLHTLFAAKSGSTAALGVMQHTRLRQRKGRTDEIGTANPLISNGFTPA